MIQNVWRTLCKYTRPDRSYPFNIHVLTSNFTASVVLSSGNAAANKIDHLYVLTQMISLQYSSGFLQRTTRASTVTQGNILPQLMGRNGGIAMQGSYSGVWSKVS